MKNDKSIQQLVFRIMRISVTQMVIMALFTTVSFATDSRGQEVLDRKVSLTAEDTEIKSILKEIEDQTAAVFNYRGKQINALRKVSLHVKNERIGKVLIELFGQDVVVTAKGDEIILKPAISLGENVYDPQQEVNLAIQVSGRVVDDQSVPLPGVNVLEKGTTNGTSTDADGKYTLTVSGNNAVLVFSFIGYMAEERIVGEQSIIDIIMTPDILTLSEIVVTGYGEQKKASVTGAVGSVTSKDIASIPVTGFDQALQGRIAGVQVTQNSGEPGGGVSIRVRGIGSLNSTSEPLYIVDGVPYGSINAINPNDIERIDVLKDAASAAIYGSRGTNGVVLVTTKRGKDKLTVSFDGYIGVQTVAKKLDLLSGSEFAKLANENLVNGGIAANPAWSNPDGVLNTDWQEAVLRTAPIQSYNATISGGNEKSSTLFSFGYFDQQGIVVTSSFKRYTVRFNTDYNITKNLKVGITANGAFSSSTLVGSNNDYSGVLQNAAYSQPTSPNITSVDGYFGLTPNGAIDPTGNTFFGWDGYASTTPLSDVNYYPAGVSNVAHTVKRYVENTPNSRQLLASAFGEYQVIPGLKMKSTFSVTTLNSFNNGGIKVAPTELNNRGQYRTNSTYSEYWDKHFQWNWINTITYDKSFGNHNIGLLAGSDALTGEYRSVNVGTSGAPDDQRVINASNASSRQVFGNPVSSSLMSYIGRINYDYAGKYLLTASIRRDGSSKFGPENKWATFPSVSVGWRVSEEGFMQSASSIFSDLKLRASYGTVGNQNIPDFKYLSRFGNDGGTYQYTLGVGQTIVGGTYATSIGDPTIRWEKSTQTNFGFDAILFKNAISITADYYTKKLEDLLGVFPIPNYAGVNGNSILRNGFSMENKGIELAINYNKKIGAVNLSVGGNFATLNNEVTKLTENENAAVVQSISVSGSAINDGGAQTRTIVGQRAADFYGYVTNGIIQDADDVANSGLGGVALGDRLYVDQNNDGVINDEDKVSLGNGLPKYTFGFNINAEYKGFDLAIILNGQAGVDIANTTKFQLYNMRYYNSTGIVNGSRDLLDSWTPSNPSNELPRNSYTAPTSNRWFSSFNVEDGSFLRVRNIQVGYSLPSAFISKSGFSKVRVYVAAQNLHTFTKYTGYDPEIGSSGQNVLTAGTDFGRYPLSKMFTLGVNCRF